MGKLAVPVLGLALVGVLAWFVFRTPGSPAPAPAAPASAAGGPAKETAPKAPPADDEAPVTRAPSRPVVNALPPRPALPALGQAATEAPETAAEPGQVVMPEAGIDDVKETVRSYFGNLPRTGKMPARVTLEELLPRSVIEGLGARPDAPVVMFGHRPPTEREAFTEMLEMNSEYDNVIGISWIEPDGTERRNYVKLAAAQKPQP